jgi:hypothetical protein
MCSSILPLPLSPPPPPPPPLCSLADDTKTQSHALFSLTHATAAQALEGGRHFDGKQRQEQQLLPVLCNGMPPRFPPPIPPSPSASHLSSSSLSKPRFHSHPFIQSISSIPTPDFELDKDKARLREKRPRNEWNRKTDNWILVSFQLQSTPQCDGKHVVVGYVRESCLDVVSKMAECAAPDGTPTGTVIISDCGLL